jgi:hypothetical protein
VARGSIVATPLIKPSGQCNEPPSATVTSLSKDCSLRDSTKVAYGCCNNSPSRHAQSRNGVLDLGWDQATERIYAIAIIHDSLYIIYVHSHSSIHSSDQHLVNLDAQFTKVLLVPHVLVRVLSLVESEDFLVYDGLDVVGFDGEVHRFELESAADEDAADGADVVLGGC